MPPTESPRPPPLPLPFAASPIKSSPLFPHSGRPKQEPTNGQENPWNTPDRAALMADIRRGKRLRPLVTMGKVSEVSVSSAKATPNKTQAPAALRPQLGFRQNASTPETAIQRRNSSPTPSAPTRTPSPSRANYDSIAALYPRAAKRSGMPLSPPSHRRSQDTMAAPKYAASAGLARTRPSPKPPVPARTTDSSPNIPTVSGMMFTPNDSPFNTTRNFRPHRREPPIGRQKSSGESPPVPKSPVSKRGVIPSTMLTVRAIQKTETWTLYETHNIGERSRRTVGSKEHGGESAFEKAVNDVFDDLNLLPHSSPKTTRRSASRRTPGSCSANTISQLTKERPHISDSLASSETSLTTVNFAGCRPKKRYSHTRPLSTDSIGFTLQ